MGALTYLHVASAAYLLVDCERNRAGIRCARIVHNQTRPAAPKAPCCPRLRVAASYRNGEAVPPPSRSRGCLRLPQFAPFKHLRNLGVIVAKLLCGIDFAAGERRNF